MNEFNQYNNVAIMAAIQEFYEQRAAARAKDAAKDLAEVAPAPVGSASRLAAAVATVRRLASTPLPLPWRRAAA